MKKIIIVGLLPLLFAGCTSSDIKMIKLQADIDKLQEQVAELHETVGIVSADDTAHAIQSDTSRISLNKEQLAIEHVSHLSSLISHLSSLIPHHLISSPPSCSRLSHRW